MSAHVDVLAGMRRAANDVARLATRLRCSGGPGHAEHISKDSAATCCADVADRLEIQRAAVAELIVERDTAVAALRTIETICTESASACRKRMGTRVGNTLVEVHAALARCKGGAA